MHNKALKTFALILVSSFALACGDGGAELVEDELGVGEGIDAQGGGKNETENEGVEEPEVEEPEVEEPEVEEPEVEEPEVEEPEVEEPFCGDGTTDIDEACDDGNDLDGDGCSSRCEIEPYEAEAEGSISIGLILDDLGSNEAPLQTDCAGTIALLLQDAFLSGDGRCFLPANFLDYVVDAEIDEAGRVEGTITITLNGRLNALPLGGTFENEVLTLDFSGATLVGGPVRGVWNGEIDASFE
jgi:cysteine-rich repeat protein